MASSYETETHWQAYQPFLPKALRFHGPEDAPEESFVRWRGLDVHVDRLTPRDPRAKLVLLHGAGGYGRMFLPCALFGRRHGLHCVAIDLPGYGLTRTTGPIDYASWVDCASDLVAAERARDGLPIVLLGGSMGGLLAYSVAARVGAAGLIATCLIDPRRAEVRRAVARHPLLGRLGPALMPPALDALRLPIRWLANMGAMSNEPALSKLVARDPCGGGNRVSLRFLRSYLESAPEVEPEAFNACPVLLAHPADDRWTPLALSQTFFDRLTCDKRLVLLEGAGHFPIEQPGIQQLERAVADFVDRLLPT